MATEQRIFLVAGVTYEAAVLLHDAIEAGTPRAFNIGGATYLGTIQSAEPAGPNLLRIVCRDYEK